jgi:GntR family transcriptional regulator
VAFVTIDPRHPLPIYAQLDHAIRGAIATGKLEAGTQLPTVRQRAVDLRINANTVARVYADLERAGVLETRRGVGTFVAAGPPPRRSARDPELAALVRRFVDEAAARGFSLADVRRHLDQFITPQGAQS